MKSLLILAIFFIITVTSDSSYGPYAMKSGNYTTVSADYHLLYYLEISVKCDPQIDLYKLTPHVYKNFTRTRSIPTKRDIQDHEKCQKYLTYKLDPPDSTYLVFTLSPNSLVRNASLEYTIKEVNRYPDDPILAAIFLTFFSSFVVCLVCVVCGVCCGEYFYKKWNEYKERKEFNMSESKSGYLNQSNMNAQLNNQATNRLFGADISTRNYFYQQKSGLSKANPNYVHLSSESLGEDTEESIGSPYFSNSGGREFSTFRNTKTNQQDIIRVEETKKEISPILKRSKQKTPPPPRSPSSNETTSPRKLLYGQSVTVQSWLKGIGLKKYISRFENWKFDTLLEVSDTGAYRSQLRRIFHNKEKDEDKCLSAIRGLQICYEEFENENNGSNLPPIILSNIPLLKLLKDFCFPLKKHIGILMTIKKTIENEKMNFCWLYERTRDELHKVFYFPDELNPNKKIARILFHGMTVFGKEKLSIIHQKYRSRVISNPNARSFKTIMALLEE